MKDKEVKEKALDSIMRDLAPVDSILFALGTEDTKDQERASLSEYLDSRIALFKQRIIAHKNTETNYKNTEALKEAMIIGNVEKINELQTIKEKFNL